MMSNLSNVAYLRHIRDSYQQTRYSLKQWDSLYREYNCEICKNSMSRICDGVSLSGRDVNDISRVCKSGRYTACINISFDIAAANDDKKTTSMHVCNFLPIVIGTSFDLSIRERGANQSYEDLSLAIRMDSSLVSRMGQVYMFDNFWVFSAFISTDARQCHQYRERTKSTECFVRMYIYDRYGKGHMLFVRPNDTALYIRDKFRRETRLVSHDGLCCFENDDHSELIVREFVRDTLISPFDGMNLHDFFTNCREYMLYGIGSSDGCGIPERSDEIILGVKERDIDHIDNKRISSACNLYSLLLRSFARNLRDILVEAITVENFQQHQMKDDGEEDNAKNDNNGETGKIYGLQLPFSIATAVMVTLRSCIVRYATMSQRANLLPFISRKTHIRRDWCESMKRQMKSEIRSNRKVQRVGNNGGIFNGCGVSYGITTSTSRENHQLLLQFVSPDVTLDNTKVTQPFYCSKMHLDVEYDHEIVKRMRVVNLNAMMCLRMPIGFERFLSYYNIGNIGNAGRVMTRTHSMRDSYVAFLDSAVERTIAWIRHYFYVQDTNNTNTTTTITTTPSSCFTVLAVNEIPILRTQRIIFEVTTKLQPYTFSLWQFVLALKYRLPGTVIAVTHLREQSYYVNVRIANGIALCPVNIFDTIGDQKVNGDAISDYRRANEFSNQRYAVYCNFCNDYRSLSCLTLPFESNCTRVAWKMATHNTIPLFHEEEFAVAVLPRCRKHVWFSGHELALYYQTFTSSSLQQRPLMHELACHGFLSVGYYSLSTEISKLIVSINAHRRALEILPSDRLTDGNCAVQLRDEWSRYGENNGKFTRLFAPRHLLPSFSTNDSVGNNNIITCIHPTNSIRLLFAFGDFDMLNCEDGYVINEKLPLFAKTLFRKKISLTAVVPSSSKKSNEQQNAIAGVAMNNFSNELDFVSRMTITCEFDHGIRIHIGTLYARVPVNISSGNDILVYQRKKRGYSKNNHNLYVYDIYIVWNSSYVQTLPQTSGTYRSCRVFRNITESTNHVKTGENNNNKLLSVKSERLMYEEHRYQNKDDDDFHDGCPITRASVEVFRRYILVSIESVAAKQTLKLQNSFGQKGIAHFSNLDDLITDRGENVDVVSSMFSFVGRSACGQLLEQRTENTRRIYSRSTGRYLGNGGVGYFFVSSDSAHNHFIYRTKLDGSNPMRMCKLTYEALLENCASSVALTKGSDFESSMSNPYAGIPRTVRNALDCYGVHRRVISMSSQRTTSMRRRMHDIAVLRRLHTMAQQQKKNAGKKYTKKVQV